jgi:hypothetical protein
VLALAPAAARADTGAALAAIDRFAPENEATFEDLERVIDEGGIAVGALRSRLNTGPPTAPRRWAAAYVAHVSASTPSDLSALRASAAQPDASVRALVLLGRLRNGDKQAIPRLIALLARRGYLTYSEPLSPLADIVDHRLTLATHADFGFRSNDAVARRRGLDRWRAWWRRVRSRIRWDPAARTYRWPGRPANLRAAPAPAAPVAQAAAASDPLVFKQTYEVTFHANVTGAERRAALRAFAGAVAFLNGAGRSGRCTPVRFEIEVREAGDVPTPGAWRMSVEEVRSLEDPFYRRSHVNHERRRGRLWTNEVTDPDIGARLIAHETAHTFGLPDEYVRDEQTGATTPVDPTSFLGNGRWGDVLQRHLDALVGNSGQRPEDCERWLLAGSWTSTIEPWREERGSTVTHHLGVSGTAEFSAPFWLDPATGAIYPAGRLPCGRLLLPAGSGPCGESSRTAKLTAKTDPGSGNCAHRISRRTAEFDLAISGRRSEAGLELRLGANDSVTAFFNCSPAADGGDERDYRLIANGMRWAGATEHTLVADTGAGSSRFDRAEEHRRISGILRATRCNNATCG